jgi:succinate-acetate transporter protein
MPTGNVPRVESVPAAGDGGAQIPARVFLRPIGSPLTAGLAGLAIGSLVEAGLSLRWVGVSDTHQVGLVLIAVPFVLQLIACVFAYLARDGSAGATLGMLSTSWLALGLVHLASVPGHTSGALGLLLLASGGTVACSAAAISTGKPLPGVVFALAAGRFAVAGIYQLSSVVTWRDADGIIGLVVTGVAVYALLAFKLEDQRHHPLLPTFRRGLGRRAMLGGPLAQLDDIDSEAGVRRGT